MKKENQGPVQHGDFPQSKFSSSQLNHSLPGNRAEKKSRLRRNPPPPSFTSPLHRRGSSRERCEEVEVQIEQTREGERGKRRRERKLCTISLAHMGTVPERGSDNRTTCRQGQEAGTGRLAHALAPALTRSEGSLEEFLGGGTLDGVTGSIKPFGPPDEVPELVQRPLSHNLPKLGESAVL
ncbi:unnamed protein product [Pleuronectes platessa]|uniref:Uncharacterized protein n=1 Tax=Pleuronectes platessa TaxID=8262 RepID=A0A9N7YJE6_PLEPL|nr:unnamed protein product [Pleuronectes platessa]